MAENLLIKFDVDTKELDFGITALEKLGKVDKATADSFRASNAAFLSQKQAISEIAKESKAASNDIKALSDANKTATASITANTESTKKSTNAFQALRQEIRNLKAQIIEAEAAGDNSLVEKLRKQAALATDKMGDLNKSIKNLSSDTRAFDAILGGARGIAAGFSVAQGASALFGNQNKDLEKTLIKLQGALALLNGLTEIQNVLQADSALGVATLSAKRVVLTGVTAGMTTAEAAATVATNTLNAATKGLFGPIGLIIGAVGALVAVYEIYVSRTKEAADITERQTRLIKFQEQAYDQLDKKIRSGNDAIVQSTNDRLKTMQLQNGTEENLLAVTLSSIKQQIIGLETLKRNRIDVLNEKGLLTKKELDDDKELVKIRQELAHLEAQSAIETLETEKKITDEKKKQSDKQLADHKKLINDLSEEDKKREDFLKKVSDDHQKRITAQRELDKKAADEKITLDKDIEDRIQKSILKGEEDEQKRVEKEKDVFNKKKDIAIQSGKEVSDALFEIDKNGRDAETEEQLNSLDVRKQAEFDALDAQTKKQLENKNLSEAQRQQIEEQAAKKKKAIDDKFRKEEAKIKTDAFVTNKQAAILQAIINTALGVTNALATGGPLAPLLAIAAGISGAAQVAVIAAQPVPKFNKGVEKLSGSGTETSDSIPAMLSKNERVVPADVNKDYFPILSAIHHRKIQPNLLNDMAMELPLFHSKKERLEIDEYAMARAMSRSIEGSAVNIANHDALARSIAKEMGKSDKFFS